MRRLTRGELLYLLFAIAVAAFLTIPSGIVRGLSVLAILLVLASWALRYWASK